MQFFPSRLIYQNLGQMPSCEVTSESPVEWAEMKEGLISSMSDRELDDWIENYKEADESALGQSFLLLRSMGQVISHQELQNKKETVEKLLQHLQADLSHLIDEKILNRAYGLTENFISYWQELLQLSENQEGVRLRHPDRLEELLEERVKQIKEEKRPSTTDELVTNTRDQMTQLDVNVPTFHYESIHPNEAYLSVPVFKDYSYARIVDIIGVLKNKAVNESGRVQRKKYAFAAEALSFFHQLGAMLSVAELKEKGGQIKEILDQSTHYAKQDQNDFIITSIRSYAMHLWDQLQAYETQGQRIEKPLRKDQPIESFSDQDLKEAIDYAKQRKEMSYKKDITGCYETLENALVLIKDLADEVSPVQLEGSTKKKLKKTLKALSEYEEAPMWWPTTSDRHLLIRVQQYLEKIQTISKDKSNKDEMIYHQPSEEDKFKRVELQLINEETKQRLQGEQMNHQLLVDIKQQQTAFALGVIRAPMNQEALSKTFIDFSFVLDLWSEAPSGSHLKNLQQQLINLYEDYSGENVNRSQRKDLIKAANAIVYQWMIEQWQNTPLSDEDLKYMLTYYHQLNEKYEQIHGQRHMLGRVLGSRGQAYLRKNYSLAIEALQTIEGLKAPIHVTDFPQKIKQLRSLNKKLNKVQQAEMPSEFENEVIQFERNITFFKQYLSREIEKMELCIQLASSENRQQQVILRRGAESSVLKSTPEFPEGIKGKINAEIPLMTLEELKAELDQRLVQGKSAEMTSMLREVVNLSLPEIFYDVRSQSARQKDLSRLNEWLEALSEMKGDKLAYQLRVYLKNWLQEFEGIAQRKQEEEVKRRQDIEQSYFGENGIFNQS